MIITIDGPAGAGKSSIAREVARDLKFDFLDTGAMYRAVTYGAICQGIDFADVGELIRFSQEVALAWQRDRILLEGEDVSDKIRTPQVTAMVRFVADPPEIRETLTELQRRVAHGRNIVTEGRDQGSEVFPDAECKVFLTASPEERARRRQAQLAALGRTESFEEILAAQNRRDLEDRMRPVGRLRPATDAVVVKSDGMSPEQVKVEVIRVIRCCLSNRAMAMPSD